LGVSFRRPVAGAACRVEIESGGGPLGPREACTSAIWEKRVAGPVGVAAGVGGDC
jgi:hypothetical protein